MLATLLIGMITMAPPKIATPSYTSKLVFAPMEKHNHGSCLVETPKGNLLLCWYRGSGERTADDVMVYGARLKKGANQWTEPFVMAGVAGFPNTNPCLFFDDTKRLWLCWSTILDNHWESALSRYKISTKYEQDDGSPVWQSEEILHLKPGAEFHETYKAEFEKVWRPYIESATPKEKAALSEQLERKNKQAQDKLSQRLGWMFRAHPTLLPNGRIILPLYSDAFDFSLMAYSDNRGESWQVTRPLIGAGNVQPSIARRKDGTLLAYFRDNGAAPQRVQTATSNDNGTTWSAVTDTDRVDSGSGVEVCVLQSGRWLLVHNDVEKGRHRLALSVSEDEGVTWRTGRYLENDPLSPDAGSYSYPSIIQAKNGTIHVSYTYRPSKQTAETVGKGSSIKHAAFNESWVLQEGTP